MAPLAAGLLGAEVLRAQGITLPTARAVGPGPVIEQLIDLVDRSATWYPTSSDKTAQAKYETLAIIRYRMLLAPFDEDEIGKLACAPTTDSLWVMLYRHDLKHVSSALVSVLRRALDEISPRAEDNKDANFFLSVAVRTPPPLRDDEGIVEYLDRLRNTYDSAKTALARAGQTIDPNAQTTAGQLEAARRSFINSHIQAIAARQAAVQSGAYAVSTLILHSFQNAAWSTAAADTALKGRCATADVVQESETALWTTMLSKYEPDARLKAELDTLGRTAQLVVIRRRMGSRYGFLPVLSTEEATEFWRQQGPSPLNIASVAGNGSSSSAFTEVASPLLHAIRLSFNAVVATGSEKGSSSQQSSSGSGSTKSRVSSPTAQAPSDSAAPTANAGDPSSLTQFVNGGGQFNLGAAWPLVFEGASNSALSGMLLIAPRVGGTLSSLNAIQQDATGYYDLGSELHVASVDFGQGSGLFAQLRYGHAGGGSSFQQSVGVKKPFDYASVAGGVMLGGKYLISGNRIIGGPRPLMSVKWQIGVTVLRSPSS